MSDKSDSGVNASPFPEASPGPVSGTNGLVRQRFVNGRALTATALRGEQSYLDARARMAAQAFSPGVVWGLGLTLFFGTKNGFYDTDSYHGNGSAH
jgi:hypothetical protein